MSAIRVATLLPSATDTVLALGAAGQLAARSHECPDVPGVPAVTASRLDASLASGAATRAAREILEAALSIYRVDANALRAAAPDVIVTQTLCEACAVTPADLEAALAAWTGPAPALLALNPLCLADAIGDIGRIGAALGRAGAAALLVASLEARIDAIAARANGLPKPRVATLEWLDPPMAGGNWLPELIALAGGENLFGTAGEHSPWTDPAAYRAAAADIVLILPCGFDIARTRRELAALPWIAALPGRKYVLDGARYFNRPGPGLVESLEILAEILHPRSFDFGHRGDGYAAWPV
jgi:iron complex transport system substrate-binding protein